MKKIKIIFISFLLLVLTGCSVKYDLNINENIIDESISISEKINPKSEKNYDEMVNNAYSQFNNSGKKKYTNLKNKKDDITTYILKQKYNFNNFIYVRAFSECFDAYNLVRDSENKNIYLLQTSKGFKCMSYSYMPIDTIEVNIKLSNKFTVLDSNSDKNNDGKYTWIINSKNNKNKYISIKFEKKSNSKSIKKEKNNDENSNYGTIILVISSIVVLVLILGFIILNLNKKNNKI